MGYTLYQCIVNIFIYALKIIIYKYKCILLEVSLKPKTSTNTNDEYGVWLLYHTPNAVDLIYKTWNIATRMGPCI